MVIENQTSIKLYVDEDTRRPIEPGVRRYVTEHMFDTTSIDSKIGHVEIITEYYQRSITASKKLNAIESEELDSNGHKLIIVEEIA